MSKPTAILAEPLTLGHETIARSAWCSGKVSLILSVIIGLVFAGLLSQVPFTRSEIEDPAISMFGATCPRPAGLAMSVNAMQDTLKTYGIAPSPMTKFALSQYAATRDASMAAHAKEEFSNLDPVTQAQVKKLSRDIVVRAASLKPEDMAGVTAPLGFFDPAGFSKNGNIAVYRSAELKHGRVCMLAVLGTVVTEGGFHPFFDNWGDGTFVSAAASHFSPTAAANFWPAFWVLTAAHEFAVEFSGMGPSASESRAPGDFGFDPLNLKPASAAELKEMQNKELNNGRLAMLAAAGIMAQELVTGKAIFR